MRLVFMGTPDFAAAALRSLIASSHEIVAVFTQPPRPAGRGHRVQKSAVHQLAEEAGLSVYTPSHLKDGETVDLLHSLEADVFVVAAYGLILPKSILDIPEWGCINIHGSLLPRWRGAAPIHRAIEAGDKETGVTLMKMAAGLDTGPMLLMECCEIREDDTFQTLHDRVMALGVIGLQKALDKITLDEETLTPQPDEGVTYAHKLTKEETQIDWKMSAEEIARRVRAFAPWPGSWTLCETEVIRLHVVQPISLETFQPTAENAVPGTIVSEDPLVVACGAETFLQIWRLQRAGKKTMDAPDFLNGFQVTASRQFS